MIYGYIRVSTDKQTGENQRFEIKKFCVKEGIQITRWVEETISSTKALDRRKLGRLLKSVRCGDMIIASEISRLGRNLLQVMAILQLCMERGVVVRTIKDNFNLDNGIQSKVLAFAFGLSAEIERNLISQRTREALARIKAEGRTLGRAHGSRNQRLKLSGKEGRIRELLTRGGSQRSIARSLHVSPPTLAAFINRNMSII
jgi:DNA invertase Pin-like site-specific DNA recombinase